MIIADPADIRCNELSTTGGRYYVNVYNTSTAYSTVGATFQLRGAAATGGAAVAPAIAVVPSLSADLQSDAAKRAISLKRGPANEGERLHIKALDQSARVFNEQRGRLMSRVAPARATDQSIVAAVPVVGDQVVLRVPDLNSGDICKNYYDITARVAYVGTRSIIVEDVTNPLRQIDSTYAAIGSEFDQRMFPILQTNFGNPLVMDALTDNNQREVMVFTHVVNDRFSNLGGFVVSCDFFPRTTYPQSNLGEYFYARVPTASGTINTANSPPQWRWTMRGTIMHESKHIASFGARVFNNASAFEVSWLEESTARLSEELYERAIYNFAQKSNIGYGTGGQVGPWCGVRACNGNPRGFVRTFEDLASVTGWFPASEDHSPLGRLDANDFSFYATGWSLVRWAIDQGTLTESAFLTALTQETSKSGVANLEARAGRLFADMLPEWSLANITDDHPLGTPTLPRLRQPSWNFRDVFSGLHTDFATTFPNTWPLVPFTRSFGSFAVESYALPGTASFIELSGTQAANQLIELKASGVSTAGAPAELRIAIVRIQ